jgi:c-di-GMP phosphodiesterase
MYRRRAAFDTFKRVEMALNRAKERTSTIGIEHYQPNMEREVIDRLRLVSELRSGFENGQFDVWFQPQVGLATGQLIGLEALLRWRRSDGEMVAPDSFVPLAESSGAIIEIGNWVFDQSCRFLNTTEELGLGKLTMAVNVTVPQFRRIGFVDSIARTLDRHRLDPSRVKLEITENIVMDEPRLISVGLEQLRKLGVRLSIDDFGTGFSSLSYLHQLPLDELKVDRAFVQGIETPKGEAIARTIILLAQQLGMSSLGEGVETEMQAQLLRSLGCTDAQGYLFCRPMPADQLLDWMLQGLVKEK